ncbi:histone acetylation protein 2 [Diplodia corticola]|uniref:Elongator complex protein 5 n=1 Tax=Diplodia corticola TaxID=236234 RepID=A0A1J9S9Z7_9PEZI|nr:histone acetylation protein 2 [Diplodia corticola]OJD36405.1 histone acetylation protein 2 [Diplodia corticola]
MSAAKQLQHRRAHNLLLISKLLNSRENASPFTLILDSLEQSGKGLAAKTRVVFVSFETLKPPTGTDTFIPAALKDPTTLQKDLAALAAESTARQKTLLIFDTLHPLTSHPSTALTLPHFLSSLLSPTTSLLATYHADVPLTATPSPYAPRPLTLLRYIATAVLSLHALPHVLAARAAQDRSVAAPVFGLGEEIEGVVAGMGRNGWGGRLEGGRGRGRDDGAAALGRGVVVEMEYRRKSGRGVREWYFVPTAAAAAVAAAKGGRETAVLLEDHPLYRRGTAAAAGGEARDGGEEDMDTTFNLGLTEKQRRDREGVVLPYFDAQREDGGPGEGGRILYDMGVEDDFDEEEDEI